MADKLSPEVLDSVFALSLWVFLICGSLKSWEFFYIMQFLIIILNIRMFSGKIYRNKPMDLEKQASQTDFQATKSPLRKVMSNGHLLQSQSSLMYTDQNEEMYEDGQKNRWGAARQYIEKSERRMRERIGSLQRTYAVSLEELEKTVEEKDAVIKALKQALEEKDKVIDTLRKQSNQALETSRSIIRQKFPLQL